LIFTDSQEGIYVVSEEVSSGECLGQLTDKNLAQPLVTNTCERSMTTTVIMLLWCGHYIQGAA